MYNREMETSKDGTLKEVVARLIRLQKQIGAECRRLETDVGSPKELGMKPKDAPAQKCVAKHSAAVNSVLPVS